MVRDRWGVPHISASTPDDLFFAQGFVQAQDRLFQMDLWRRASLGRLSEVLGANFIQRDAMTRRMQYRGDLEEEWRAYGPDTKTIVTAFVHGINAFIDHSRGAWPDEFRLAGWTPEHWQPEDLLNRTDAFVASRGAQDAVFFARLIAAIGVEAVNGLFALPPVAVPVETAVDLAAITPTLGETIGRAGARPFFAGFASSFAGSGSNVFAVDGTRTASGSPLLAVDPHRPFDAPALRYLVALHAPGWHVAGATSPWLPGVVIGHNEHVAWGMASASSDVQDVYVEQLNPANPKQVRFRGRWEDMTVALDRFPVKGRSEPYEFEREYTRHGAIVGVDRDRHLAYALRWSGSEAGAAAELASLGLARASSLAEFTTAVGLWKMPSVDIVAVARGQKALRVRAGLEPVRDRFSGVLPIDGWSGRHEWQRFSVPGTSEPPLFHDLVFATNGDTTRFTRVSDVLARERRFTVERFEALQRDVQDGDADLLVRELERVDFTEPAIGEARRRLLAWDRQLTPQSPDRRLFEAWHAQLKAMVASDVPMEFREGLMARLEVIDTVGVLEDAAITGKTRDQIVRESFAAAVAEVRAEPVDAGAARYHVTFSHPLAISDAARARFNVGPFPMGGGPHTVQAISDRGRIGPGFRAVFDVADWDRSMVINAPGQSGWPDSPHYKDLAALWAEGKTVPLAFSAAAVQAAAQSTLTLTP